MRRRIHLFAIVLITLYFSAGCGQNSVYAPDSGSKDSIIEKAWCSFGYLPDGFSDSDCKLLQLPDRQQSIVPSDNSGGRIVFEVILKGSDSTEASEYDDVSVIECDGICYIYGDNNTINYQEIDKKIESKMYRPETGDTVLEWKDNRYSYRLYGTVSRDELILIAEGIVGI